VVVGGVVGGGVGRGVVAVVLLEWFNVVVEHLPMMGGGKLGSWGY
jgi:hypothetical protein